MNLQIQTAQHAENAFDELYRAVNKINEFPDLMYLP